MTDGELVARIEALEARLTKLEGRAESAPSARPRAGSGSRGNGGAGGGGGSLDGRTWTRPYEIAQLEVSETWIELHEPSARPQLQRLIRQVVQEEGPVTDRLVLDRIRRAWGLKRAGGRVQDAFDQALRQLLARGLVERDGDALSVPGSSVEHVRVPGADEATRRGAEDVPVGELALALRHGAAQLRVAELDDLTMQVAKLFGWTRRGGAIQERLDAAVAAATEAGWLQVEGSGVRAG